MARTILRAGKILVVMIFMTASLLLMLLSLWSPAQTGTAPPGDEETVDSSLIADVPLEEEPNALWEERYELVGQRDQNHRTWQVIRGLEAIDPVTNEATVEEVISKVVEVGDGICYQDPNGTWQVTHPRWVEVGGGFTMYTAGYKLDIGRRLGSGLRYELNGESVFLTPSHIVAYDGAYLGDIAKLDSQAVGMIDPNDSSRLVFADGFGRGIDVVFSVSSGGYHQDIVFHDQPRLSGEFDPENTHVFVYTELNAEPAQVDGTIDIVMEGGASQSFSKLSETPPPNVASP